jgi:outer membrane protein TolC
VGFKAFNPAHLLAIPESLVGNLAGNMTAPLINRSAIEAQYRTADAKQVQAIIQYERSILQAFTDVSNQLANLTNMKNAYNLRSQQVKRLSNSVDLSTVLFKAARADYVEVLLTRRDLLEAQLELIERRKLLQQSVVNLYQALGGGWRSGQPATPQGKASAGTSKTVSTASRSKTK